MRSSYTAYFAGRSDFLLHGLEWIGIDFPVSFLIRLLVLPLSLQYTQSERIWNLAVSDAMYLVLGTALWFVYGYFISRLFTRRYLYDALQWLKAKNWWKWQTARTSSLFVALLYLFRYEVLRRTPLRGILAELSMAEGFVVLMMPVWLTLLVMAIELRSKHLGEPHREVYRP